MCACVLEGGHLIPFKAEPCFICFGDFSEDISTSNKLWGFFGVFTNDFHLPCCTTLEMTSGQQIREA